MLVLKIRRVSNLQIVNSGSPIIEQTEKVWVRPNYTKFRGGRRSKNMEGPLVISSLFLLLFFSISSKFGGGLGPWTPRFRRPCTSEQGMKWQRSHCRDMMVQTAKYENNAHKLFCVFAGEHTGFFIHRPHIVHNKFKLSLK